LLSYAGGGFHKDGASRMFHDMFTICFTICLFISPDLDGHRAPKMKYVHDTNSRANLNWEPAFGITGPQSTAAPQNHGKERKEGCGEEG